MSNIRKHAKRYVYYAVVAGLSQLWFPENVSFYWLFLLLVLLYHTERLNGRDFL